MKDLSDAHTILDKISRTSGRGNHGIGFNMDTASRVIGRKLEVANGDTREVVERLECNILLQRDALEICPQCSQSEV